MGRRVKLRRRLAGSLGILLFAVGLLLGMGLFGVVIWADLEAALFSPGLRQDAALRSLRCPVMITKWETGTVSASVTNPLDRPTERYVRAHISDGYVTLMREINTSVSLAPGETERLAWTVRADDAAFERLILVKVVVRGRYPLPSRDGTCGILVVDVPVFSGNQVFGLSLVVSLLSMAAGFGLWYRSSQPLHGEGRQAIRAMGVLTGSIVAGTFVGWLGLWVPGLILFVITVLGIGAIIGYFLNTV